MRPEASAIAAALSTAERLAHWVKDSVRRLSNVLPADDVALENLNGDQVGDVDAFLNRFSQLQDTLSKRLLRAVLVELAEDVNAMSARDAFARGARLGLIEDDDRFTDMHRLRNRLVHEYPMDDQRRAERINAAWALTPALLDEFTSLAAHARRLIEERGEA